MAARWQRLPKQSGDDSSHGDGVVAPSETLETGCVSPPRPAPETLNAGHVASPCTLSEMNPSHKLTVVGGSSDGDDDGEYVHNVSANLWRSQLGGQIQLRKADRPITLGEVSRI